MHDNDSIHMVNLHDICNHFLIQIHNPLFSLAEQKKKKCCSKFTITPTKEIIETLESTGTTIKKSKMWMQIMLTHVCHADIIQYLI